QTCPSFLTYLDRLVFAQGSSKCSYFPFPSQYRDLWRSPECEEGGRSCHCETKEMKVNFTFGPQSLGSFHLMPAVPNIANVVRNILNFPAAARNFSSLSKLARIVSKLR
ncbi:hypothetical protein LINGRAHAP2_LOCUS32447, partial [Linum grandiflorum]